MMNKKEKSYPLSLEDRLLNDAREARVINCDGIRKSIVAYSVTKDKSLYSAIQASIGLKKTIEKIYGIPFDLPSEKLSTIAKPRGKYIFLGFIKQNGKPLVIEANSLREHALFIGATGTGKTNQQSSIALQLMRQGIPVWIYDRDKEDYRHLYRFYKDLLIFTKIDQCPNNPLEHPASVKPEHWLGIFVDTFTKSTGLLVASISLLSRAVKELYESNKIFAGSDNFPTMHCLYRKVKSYNFKGNYRSSQYQDSILNRLDGFLSFHGESYSYQKGVPIEILENHSFVLELKGLPEHVARFEINIRNYKLFLHRIATGARGNIIRTAVLVDEAKFLAPYGFNELSGFSPLAYVMAQARETGIGFLCSDQTAMLEDTLYTHSKMRTVFRLNNGEDLEKIKKTFFLNDEQVDFVNNLGTGEFILRLPQEPAIVAKAPKLNFE